MNIIKKVPIPICGVMLGTAALGNLLQSYSEGVRYFCGIMAAIFLVLILLKLIMFPGMIKEDMNNPIMASVSGTFSMALMLFSVYLKPFIGQAAFVIWIIAILLHIALIIYFTVKFILKLEMPKVFASYYIVYVGIAVASITAPAYEQLGIGSAAFWFGLIALIILLVLVTIRYVKYPQVPDPAKPLICIYAAPMSLCLAGYVQSVTPKNFTFLMVMFVVATVLYLFSLVQLIGCLKLPFFPSYAAFTFPFVISAIASKQTMACAANMGNPLPWLQYVVLIETIIAVVLVAYTYIRFVAFLFSGNK
jgi:exfoliative toxin A/B